jgi:hypothetical protein
VLCLKWRIGYQNQREKIYENFCMVAMFLFLKSWWEELRKASEFSSDIALVPHISASHPKCSWASFCPA